MTSLHSYNFPQILAAIAQALGRDIRPMVDSAHHKQQIDMMCLLLSQAGSLIDEASQDIFEENDELEDLIRRSIEIFGSKNRELLAETEALLSSGTGGLAISHLSSRNSDLKFHINKIVDWSFKENISSALIHEDLISVLVRANSRRKPPMMLRGM